MKMDGQMKFDLALNSEQRVELHIPVNKSVEPQDKPRLSRQAQAIYERLQSGPATTSELATIGLQYSARLSECRHYIIKQGKMIDMVEGSGGENTFKIVELNESRFWKKVKDKGEVWKWQK